MHVRLPAKLSLRSRIQYSSVAMNSAASENGVNGSAKRVKMSHASLFEDLEACPPDPIFGINDAFHADKDPKKVNLVIGVYRTEEGQPWVLPVVRTIEAQMSADPTLNHEYLPLDGLRAFTERSCRLLLGDSCRAIAQNRVCGVQALSGTGSLRLGFEFLKKHYPNRTVYLSSPTWGNHKDILAETGHGADLKYYRYYDKKTRGLDYEGMLEDLRAAPEGAVILLHACAHNPTGVDPSKEQWKGIVAAFKERKLFPFFDSAYQGFATGDLDGDAWAVREFVEEGFEVFTAMSFSKNFGIYNERAGLLCCAMSSPEMSAVVKSHLKPLCRRMWSTAPNHGSRIVATALGNPSLYQEWKDNLTTMSDRIRQMRQDLYHLLKAKGTPGSWDHIINQIGMFSFTGLTPLQVEYLTKKYHIYLLKNGRINMCGLNPSNLDYVSDAIKDAVTVHPEK